MLSGLWPATSQSPAAVSARCRRANRRGDGGRLAKMLRLFAAEHRIPRRDQCMMPQREFFALTLPDAVKRGKSVTRPPRSQHQSIAGDRTDWLFVASRFASQKPKHIRTHRHRNLAGELVALSRPGHAPIVRPADETDVNGVGAIHTSLHWQHLFQLFSTSDIASLRCTT